MVTAYQLLGVPENASSTEILRAYRKEMLKYHPDRNPGHAGEEKAKLLNRAKDLLTDPVKRGRYDEYLRKQKATATKPIAAERSAQGDVIAEEEPIATSDESTCQSSEVDTNDFAWLNELHSERTSSRSSENQRNASRSNSPRRTVRKQKQRAVPLVLSVPLGGIAGLFLAWLLLKFVFHRDLLDEFNPGSEILSKPNVTIVTQNQQSDVATVPVPAPDNTPDVPELTDSIVKDANDVEQAVEAGSGHEPQPQPPESESESESEYPQRPVAIDLLNTLRDTQEPIPTGWKFSGNVLIATADARRSTLQFPLPDLSTHDQITVLLELENTGTVTGAPEFLMDFPVAGGGQLRARYYYGRSANFTVRSLGTTNDVGNTYPQANRADFWGRKELSIQSTHAETSVLLGKEVIGQFNTPTPLSSNVEEQRVLVLSCNAGARMTFRVSKLLVVLK